MIDVIVWFRESLSSLMDNDLFQGGLFLMLLGALAYQLRAIPRRAWGLSRRFSCRTIEIRDTSRVYDAAIDFVTRSAVSPQGPRHLQIRDFRVDDNGNVRHSLVASQTMFLSRIAGRPCVVNIARQTAGPGNGGSGFGGGPSDIASMVAPWVVTITVPFARRATLERIVELISSHKDRMIENGVPIRVFGRYRASCVTYQPDRPMDTICATEELKHDLIDRIQRFVDSGAEYKRRAQPWRLGILIVGEPGTGKTSIVHALASRFRRSVCVMSLNDVDCDSTLFQNFQGTPDNSIILLEDVDCLYNERSGRDAEGVSFSGFLNAIDGIGSPSGGRILVMTTNHPEKLDDALIRPGRIDYTIELGSPDRATSILYAKRMYGSEAGSWIGNHENAGRMTGAQLEAELRKRFAEI